MRKQQGTIITLPSNEKPAPVISKLQRLPNLKTVLETLPTCNSTANAISNKSSCLNIFEEEKNEKNSNLDELQQVYSRLVSDT